MNELTADLTKKLTLAKTDRIALNNLVIEYMPFIKKSIGGVFFKTAARRDYITEAMLAFIHSVQTYKNESGAFIPYAQTVIRNRLIDAARKEIKLKKSFFSISINTEEKTAQWEAAARQFDLIEEQKNLQIEILDINREFAAWGFDWAALQKNCPKQERSRRVCRSIVKTALSDNELIKEMLQKRKMPVQQLAALTGCSTKILEKYRRYIAAIILIMKGDYPYIHSFLPDFEKTENAGGIVSALLIFLGIEL